MGEACLTKCEAVDDFNRREVFNPGNRVGRVCGYSVCIENWRMFGNEHSSYKQEKWVSQNVRVGVQWKYSEQLKNISQSNH